MLPISRDAVASLMEYDHISGKLFWLVRPDDLFPNLRSSRVWNSRYSGKEAFTAVDAGGYKTGRVMGKTYYAHRIAWLLHTGKMPDGQIDHINGVRTDNRIENLRLATHSQNCRNSKSRSASTSPYLGVSYNTSRSKWEVRIKVGNRLLFGGMFSDEVAAAKSYDRMAAQYFSEFARLNFPKELEDGQQNPR